MDETATAALLYRKILVPCVDLASATASITAAAALATVFDSEMLVLHVVHPKEYVDYAKEHIHDRVTPCLSTPCKASSASSHRCWSASPQLGRPPDFTWRLAIREVKFASSPRHREWICW